MVRYELVTRARDWITWLPLVATSGVVVWLSTRYSIAWAFLLGYPVLWGWWCAITDRAWQTRVGDGKIAWNTLFSKRERTVAIADITAIELKSDNEGGRQIFLAMAGGERLRFNGHILYPAFEHPKLISALVAENPEINVRYT